MAPDSLSVLMMEYNTICKQHIRYKQTNDKFPVMINLNIVYHVQ